jgi:hypothetical protein
MPTMPLNDDVLGVLNWDQRTKDWSRSVQVSPEHSFLLTFDAQETEIEDGLPHARQTFQFVRGSDEAIRRFASQELISDINDGWLEDETIDENEFIARIHLNHVVLRPDGAATLFYTGDQLLFDHVIVIPVTANHQLEYASIEG